MPDINELRDQYTLELGVTDNMSAPTDAIAAKLDNVVKSAEAAAAEVAGLGGTVKTAADQVTAAGAAWDRVARRNDDVSAAVYRLKAAQEELTRTQAQAQRALEAGSADQATVNRVLDEQVQKVERAAAALIDVREASEGAAEAQRLWQGQIADSSDALTGLQGQLSGFAAASQAAFAKQLNITAPTSDADYAKRAADIAAYGAALDALRAKVDPLFAASKAYETQLDALNDALSKGAVPLEVYDSLLDGLNTSFAKSTASLGAFTAKTQEYAQAAQAAFNKQLNVSDPTSDSDYAKRAADIAAYGESLDALRSKFDPVFAASKAFEAQFNALNEAVATGALPIAKYDAALDDLNASFAKVAIGTDTLAARQAEQVKAAAAQAASLDALRAKIDPVFALSKAYEAQLTLLNQALASGALPAAQAEAALDRLNLAFERQQKAAQNMVVSHGQAAFAVRQLGVQTVQFFSSIEAGQSVFTAFVQQGHQVLDVALATGTGFGVLKEAAQKLWAVMTTPLGLTITGIVGVTAAIVGLGYAAEVTARSQAKLQDELSATRTDYLAVAEAVKSAGRNIAAASPASSADATAAAQTLASSPRIDASRQSLTQLGTTAQFLSEVLGKSLQDTATLINEAATDPAKVATTVAASTKALTELDSVTLTSIIHMQQMGDVAGANAKLMDAFGKAADVAKNNQTELQKASERLATALRGSGDDTKSYWQHIGEAIDSMVAKTINGVAAIIEAINRLKQSQADYSKGGIFGGAMARWFDDLFGVGKTGQEVTDTQLQKLKTQFPSLFQPAPAGSSVLLDQTPGIAAAQQGHGLFQVTPGTAAARGLPSGFIDQNTAQNMVAALSLMNSLFQQGRDATSITQAYGGFSAGNTAGLNAKMGKLNAADIGKLPTDVQGGIAFIAQLYGWPDWLTKLAMQTAVVESSGQQFGNAAGKPMQTVTVTASLADQTQAADAQKGALSLQNYDQQAKKLGELNEQLRLYNASLAAATKANDPEQIERYNKAIAQTKADIEALVHPTEAATKALQDQGTVAALVYEADRQRAAGELAIARQREQNPLHPISDQDAAAQINAQLGQLSAAYDQQVKKTQIATDEQIKLTVAWASGAKAAADATIQQQAYTVVANQLGVAVANQGAAVAAFGIILKNNAQALDENKAAQQSLATAQQIEVVQAETGALLENGDARALMVQHMKDQFAIQTQLPNLSDQEKAALLAQKDALAQVTQELNNQKQTASYLSQQFSSAFDAIGQAITQTFVQGEGAAVKWSNVMQGVVTQVIQAFAHLAILNPLTNSLFGGNQPTLSSAFALLSGGSGGGAGGGLSSALQLVDLGNGVRGFIPTGAGIAGVGGISSLIGTQAVGASAQLGGVFGGGSIGGLAALYASGAGQGTAGASGGGAMGLLSNAGSLFSVGKALFPDTFGSGSSMFSGLGESLGLTGSDGVLSGLTNLLNTPLIVSSAPGPVTSGLAAGGAGLPGTVTLGGVLGAAGAGYGVGSLVGGYVQGALNKTGPGPEIGAAIGTAAGIAGVVLAPATFGTSLLVGGLIGGALGGAAGGLIGPHPASAFSSTMVNLSDGLLSVGGTASQRVDASAERSSAISDVDTINRLLQSRGLTITSLAGANTGAQYFQVGQNTPGGFQDPSKFSSVGAAFPSLRFSSQDALTNQFIQGRLFQSPEELAGVTTSLADFENVLKGTKAEADTMGIALRALSGVANTDVQPALQKAATFITATFPALTAGAPGSLATAQSQVYAQYSDALASAQQYGFGFDDLKAAQQKLYDKNNKAAQDAVDATAASVQNRLLAAQATVSGSPQDAMNAQLAAFDTNAKQTRQQLSDTLTGIWGDAYATTADYAQRMADNDKATAEERLAIQVQFNKQQVQNQQTSDQQLAALQARVMTSAAALTGNPQQIQAAQVNALNVSQAAERAQYISSEQQTYGDLFGTADPNNLDKWIALLSAQNNEMQLLQQQIARTNLQNRIASDQQNQGFSVRSANAQAALNPAFAPQAARYAADVQAQQEQQALYLSLTATYGDAYALTQDYADKLTALQKVQGDERLVLEQTLHDRQMQQDIANQQQDANLRTRVENARAQLIGDPTTMATAQIDALRAQQLAERQSFQVSLLSTFGDAYASTKEYYDKLAALNDAQVAEMQLLQAQIDRASLERNIASQQQNQSFATRYTNAAAQVSGSVSDQNAAALAAFDAQAQAEIQNLYLSLTATYGVAYALTQDYANKLTALQKAQGEERLALQKQQDDALKSQAVGTISSLNQYAISLQTGDKSPLSPKAQLDLAQRQFETQAQLASHGNYAAVQTLQQYSEAYLAAAHTVFGSGMDYVQAFSKVISTLATVASQSPDALTASILQTETRTQTAILVEQLQELQDEVKQLRLQLVQGQTAPARVG